MTKEQTFKVLKGIKYVVINRDWGGFGLSEEAFDRYLALTGITDKDFSYRDIARDDPYLVQVVRELGEAADSEFAALKIVEIPSDIEWQIQEYDGREWVAEKHRTWS